MSYKKLQKYYRDILCMFDTLHYNSQLAQGVYESHIGCVRGDVVSISHGDIEDHRRKREFGGDLFKMVFIGNTTLYKGFPILESILVELTSEGFVDWELAVWGGEGRSESENIRFRGEFAASQLEEVFHDDSLLIIPSVWSETFGFTALEAISFGTPVLVSSTVGSKDIIAGIDPWFIYSSIDELKARLRELFCSRDRLRTFNHRVVKSEWGYSLADHTAKIKELYNR